MPFKTLDNSTNQDLMTKNLQGTTSLRESMDYFSSNNLQMAKKIV